MGPDKEKADLEKKIKELEEKIKRLEEKRDKGEEEGGIAESILEGLGNLIPGLGGLVKSLAKSEAFRERLEAVDEELEERLRAEPLKGVKVDVGVRQRLAVRGIPQRPPGAGKPRAKKRKTQPKVKPEVIDSSEFPVDVFDEEDYLRVIAEMPGLEKKDIQLDLERDQLTISAKKGKREYHRVISLPSKVSSVQDMIYRQGVLEVLVEKA